jgi:hypothetical protein
MAVFLVLWISPAVNSTKSFKNLSEKGYCLFLEPFAMLFMQLRDNGQLSLGWIVLADNWVSINSS